MSDVQIVGLVAGLWVTGFTLFAMGVKYIGQEPPDDWWMMAFFGWPVLAVLFAFELLLEWAKVRGQRARKRTRKHP